MRPELRRPAFRRTAPAGLLVPVDAVPERGPTGGRTDRVIVGRTAELAAVRGLVDRVAAGRGGALLVAGEAGIGKTRLLDELAARAAERGVPVHAGRAVPGGGTFRAVAGAVLALDDPARAAHPTLRGYRTALGRLLPGWAGIDPGPGPADALGVDVDPTVVLAEGLLRLLRLAGDGRGCVLRLEDLHWADEDTVALVEHLAAGAAAAPVLLACSVRDDSGPDDAPARTARRLANTPGVVVLRPGRLTEEQVGALAAARRGGRPLPGADVRRLRERADGLPLAVDELLATPAAAVPPTMAALVADRLTALDAPVRAVLHVAAVLGPELDWRLLATVADTPEPAVVDALRAAAEQALLVADGPALRWRHALTRDAVLAVLLPPERAALAGRAARALAARAGPADELRAAELFVEAREPDAAVALLLRLARRDAARGALRSAERLLATAADATVGTRLAASLTAERVAVLTLVGRTADALALGAAQLDTPTALIGDDHADLCLQLARTAVTAGAWDDAAAFVGRAGRPGDPRSLVLRADAAFGAGRTDDALVLATDAIARAEEVVDGPGAAPSVERHAAAALCEALGVAGRLAWRTDLDVTEALARRAEQVAAEHGLLPWRAAAVFQLGMMRMLRDGDLGTMHRARELALDAGMLGQVVALDYVRSDHLWLVDGPAAALPTARGAAELGHRLRLPAGAFDARSRASMLGTCADVVAGRRAGSGPPVLAADRVSGPRLTVALRALTALVEHDLPRAATELEIAARTLRHDAAVLPPLVYLGAYALVTAAVGRPPGVDARSFAAAQVAANRGAFAWADAVAHGGAGRPAEAAALLARGAADLAGVPWWRRLLHTIVLERAVLDGWGDPVPTLRADLAAHERAGDVPLARTCRDLLRRAGAPAGRTAAGVPPRLRAHGVTRREAEVLELVAQGLTNARIAERLFLSTRTVDTHVANLLAKTGAAGRTELGAWAGEPQ